MDPREDFLTFIPVYDLTGPGMKYNRFVLNMNNIHSQ